MQKDGQVAQDFFQRYFLVLFLFSLSLQKQLVKYKKERFTAGQKVDDLGHTPYDYLNNAQKRVATSQGEKLCSMKSHDFIWAKSEMQGFRDDMEDSYS